MLQQKVFRGSPLKISADTFNTVLDAAQDLKNRRLSRSVPSSRGGGADVVLVRNDSGADRDQYDGLGLDVPVILPSENENEFMQRWALSPVLPTADHEKKFCILMDAIPSGDFGRARVVGATPVII